MLWRTGLLLLVLVFGQVPAEDVKPMFIEDALEKGSSNAQSRIVSGWEAYPGQHPHQVNLRMVNAIGSVNGCGGSLVSRQWVITAAHCTATRITIVIRLGVTNMTSPQHLMESNEWYNHPSFNDLTPNVVQPNEVAMLKLPRPAVYTRLVQPIRIQSSVDAHMEYEEEILYASGHGHIWTGGPAPEVLNWVYLRGVSHNICQGTFPSVVNENTICARWFNVTSQSTCQGDSGGPLVHVNAAGVPILVGVTSFVAGGDFGCHSGIPAGFIRPGPFHSWFTRVTGIDFENLVEEEDEDDDSDEVTTPAPEEEEDETTKPPIEEEEGSEEDSGDESGDDSESDDSSDSDSDERPPVGGSKKKKLEVKVKVKVKLQKEVKIKKKVHVKKKHPSSHSKFFSPLS